MRNDLKAKQRQFVFDPLLSRIWRFGAPSLAVVENVCCYGNGACRFLGLYMEIVSRCCRALLILSCAELVMRLVRMAHIWLFAATPLLLIASRWRTLRAVSSFTFISSPP